MAARFSHGAEVLDHLHAHGVALPDFRFDR